MTTPSRALIVVDAQQEYFDGLLPIQYPPRDESIGRIRRAIDVAENAGIPVVIVQHELPADAPVFAAGSPAHRNHPDIAAREHRATHRVSKQHSSVFARTGLTEWLRERNIDTVTLAGFMTNNCILASAADAEPRRFAIEVLSDATGAIDLSNEAGRASAKQIHETLMALLHSNWAAVTRTQTWIDALKSGAPLSKSDLVTSAARGRTGN